MAIARHQFKSHKSETDQVCLPRRLRAEHWLHNLALIELRWMLSFLRQAEVNSLLKYGRAQLQHLRATIGVMKRQ